jgi:hypothetical protein
MNAKNIESKLAGMGALSGSEYKPQDTNTGRPAEITPEGRSTKVRKPVMRKKAALLNAFHHWVMSRS